MSDLIVNSAIEVFRALAIGVAAFVIFDVIQKWRGATVHVLNHDLANMAWFVCALGVMGGAIVFMNTPRETNSYLLTMRELGILFIWWGLSTGLTIRALARVPRPKYIAMAALAFTIIGFIYELAIKVN